MIDDPFKFLRATIRPGKPPLEFDLEFYRLLYDDLKGLNDEALVAHYEIHGRNEGRLASPAAHRRGFLALVPEKSQVLEIGPFTKPSLKGKQVRYFDVLDRTALRQRAERLALASDGCPEIDFVSPNGDLSIIEDKFDIILSSHCIEHQPDLIAHLRDIERILKPCGRYFVIAPDKRYCFDALLPESTLEEVKLAHAESRRVHSWRSVMEHRVLTTHNDPIRHWAGDSADPNEHLRSEREAAARAEYEAAAGAYIDVHGWQFTPQSFKSIVTILFDRKMIGLSLERVYDTMNGCNEFTAILTKNRGGRRLSTSCGDNRIRFVIITRQNTKSLFESKHFVRPCGLESIQ